MEKLSDIIKSVELSKLIQQQKDKIKIEFSETLLFSFNQGVFKADQQTILFAKLLSECNVDGVLIDSNDIPIQVADLKQFIKVALETYSKAVNKYLDNFNQLQKLRIKETILDE